MQSSMREMRLWFVAAALAATGMLTACSESADEGPTIPDASAPQTVSESDGLFTFGLTEPREITDQKARSSLQARGEYLAKAVAACGSCHAADPSEPDSALSGGMLMRDRFGSVRAANITPDRDTGIGTWGMADVMRAVRASISKDGTPISIDLHSRYRWMSDADARALAVYVLSQAPVSSKVERRELSQFERRSWGIFSQHRDFEGYVPALSEQRSDKWGRYLSSKVAGCYSCHTAEGGVLSDADAFAGGEGRDRSIIGAAKGLFSLLKGEVTEAQRKDKQRTIQSLLSKEGGEDMYGSTEATVAVAEPAVAANPRLVWQKPEFNVGLEEGVFPFSGPDIRGSSEAGLSAWTEADIVNYLSYGKTPGSSISDPRACPWPYFSRMTGSDKLAIARFLKSL